MSNDISYLAGILDGEGCFSIQKSGGTYRTTIQVGNNSTALVKWLHKSFGGSVSHRAATITEEHQDIWIMASKPAIAKLLPAVIPELIVRRLQASILLEFCQKFNVGRARQYTVEQYQEMAKYHQLLMLANSKGPGSNELKATILNVVGGNNAERT